MLCQEALLSLAEHVSPGFVIKGMVKHGATSKSPKVLEELAKYVETFLKEFGPGGFPLQEAIGFAVAGCGNSNKKVRETNIAMVTSIYSFVGDPIRDFLKDVKDSTMKVIDAAFAKCSKVDASQFKSSRQVKTEDGEEAKEPAGGMLDSIPRADVSKELGSTKLIDKLTDKNWKVKKQGYDKIEQVLANAEFRIEPTGLSNLMGALKQGLVDKNKNVLKTALKTIVVLARSLGPGCRIYNKTLMTKVLQCLADKQTLVRNCNMDAIEAWRDALGAEYAINLCEKAMKPDNPEIRTVLLDWIFVNKSSSDVVDNCLHDKTPSIRQKAEAVVIETMKYVQIKHFYDEI